MSQARLRMRKLGVGVMYAYWAFAGVVGTLTMVSTLTQHLAQSERMKFADQLLATYRLGHRVEICPDACFTQDHQRYLGIQILPIPESNNKKE